MWIIILGALIACAVGGAIVGAVFLIKATSHKNHDGES